MLSLTPPESAKVKLSALFLALFDLRQLVLVFLDLLVKRDHRLVDLALKLFGCEVNPALVLGTDRRFALVAAA